MAAERMKAYHDKWPTSDIMKARGQGIIIDGGEAWKYDLTHTDEFGTYDLWFRHPDPLSLNEVTGPGGMTLRDYFAGQALAGFAAGFNGGNGDADWFEQIGGKAAYRVADAMLEARKGGA